MEFVRSNVREVIHRLKRLQEGLPGVIRDSAAPVYWLPRLEASATKTIRALWASERVLAKRELYERLTPKIVATVTGAFVEHGVDFLMHVPTSGVGQDGGVNVAAASQYNLGVRTPTGRIRKYAVMEEEQQKNLEATRQAVRDWVMLEKRRDERDTKADGTPLSDEEIADRILQILGLKENAAPGRRGPETEAAAEALSGAIQRWLAGEGETPPTNPGKDLGVGGGGVGLDPETLRQWLNAVLLAWRSLLLAGIPDRIALGIRKLWNKASGEMI